jgi:hypothetical protein
MLGIEINYLAVGVAALINMVIGAFWYSPLLFATEWMRHVGKTSDDLKTGGSRGYLIAAVGALLQAYIFAHFIQYAAATTWQEGAITGFWLWLGFVAVTSAVNSTFAGRPWGLWKIDSGYFLVGLVINGALLAVWQ